jgi:Zn-dependent M32 family carboxypeptidase
MTKKKEKLKKYLEHFAGHNDSHKESFVKWREISKEEGWDKVAENLNKAIEMMDESTEYLKKARNELL